MKNFLIDILGIVGFLGCMYGIYIDYGLSKSLMTAGTLLVIYSILAARRE